MTLKKKINNGHLLVGRSNQPIPVTAIPLPTEFPEEAIKPIVTQKPECALGLGVVATQYFECTKKNGKFFRKFHPYPECYSDYVCFLPSPGVYVNQPCISIDGNVYCSADISNIRYCKYGSKSYDFKKCVEEASNIFPGFIYKVVKPKPLVTTLIPITKPKTTTTTTTTTTITTFKPIFTVKPLCPEGAGEVMNQFIECDKNGGRFYHKFYPYPDCYSDFVCFLPAGDFISTQCIRIDNKVYCSANISNIDSCKLGTESYNFKKCVQQASIIFPDFIYQPIVPITIKPTIKPTIIRPTIKPTIDIKVSKEFEVKEEINNVLKENDAKEKINNGHLLVGRSNQPIPVTAIPLPTEFPEEAIKPIVTQKPECALGLGVVATQYFECTKKNGKFFRKFHPYPECYSDYVCFLPSPGVYVNQPCISIDGNVYCSADISNIRYCKYGSKSYDFKKCVEEASNIFPGFIYKVVKPKPLVTTLIPITKPKTTTTTTTTTTITTFKPIFTVKPLCPEGAGEVMNQFIECDKNGGRFYHKFYPYPDCYSDFVCFLPAKDIQTNRCIKIDSKLYCSANITNIGFCRYGSKSYNFRSCIKKASELFPDFRYE